MLHITERSENSKSRMDELLSTEPKNGDIMYQIGCKYISWEFKDEKKAIEWLTKAANIGNTLAMNDLGYLYHHTKKKNIEKAIEWYSKAVSLHCDTAMFSLAGLYEKLDYAGTKDKIVSLYRESIILGNRYSMEAFATFYEIHNFPEKAVAVDVYTSQVAMGNECAIHNLGRIYQDSRPPDIEKAIECYLEGVKKGYSNSMNNLGYLYRTEERIKDETLALEMYNRAALAGNPNAHYNIAIVYTDRNSKNYNVFKAGEYFAAAYKLYTTDLDKKACLHLILCCFPNQDKEKCIEYFYGVHLMRKEIDDLRIEMDFRPDGPGAIKARVDFELLANRTI
ncbi:MAG: hypothetical protein Harvfovirus17_2 [Harvfovirus sp.]|uniref:Sel1 repeat family protein n=1 Tax=Harvfovirus sp. TaxID=2487768 RepID=A0A3G5A1L3_9VIRU|nr:MAG: hypothetical protein Harvfovirus17_2 [Harvfovirus sp.]